MTVWDDLNARARGLATHLLGRAALDRMARAADLPAVATELAHRGYPVPAGAGAAPALDLGARRAAGTRLALLARRAGHRAEPLRILFEDEDRRSIVALLRGAAAGAPEDQRLAGLVPTPALPERALRALARQSSLSSVAALLGAWRHPLADDLPREATAAEPDLLRLETAVTRVFARRALAGARRTGRHGLLSRYVRDLIDQENAWAALSLSSEREARPADYWLEGGERLTREVFERAFGAGGPAAAAPLLATALAGTPIAAALADAADRGAADLERRALAGRIRDLQSEARHAPLSPAPLLWYALRLRAEVLDLRWLAWGLTLGAPPALLADGLASV